MTDNKQKILNAADDKMLIMNEGIVEESKNALLDTIVAVYALQFSHYMLS